MIIGTIACLGTG